MNQPISSLTASPPRRLSRRSILGAAAGASLIGVAADRSSFGCSTPSAETPGSQVRVGQRILVVVGLDGGNDGLSTLVPYRDSIYHRLRPTTALGRAEVTGVADDYGFHAQLAPIVERGVAAVVGVGAIASDLSHFEMARRWAVGDAHGNGSGGTQEAHHDGVLGRLCSAIRSDPLFCGVAVGGGLPPIMRSTDAPAVALSGPDAASLLHQGDEKADAATRRAIEMMGAESSGLASLLTVDDFLGDLPTASDRYPEHGFGQQLRFVSQLLRSNRGVQVVHVPMAGADFDTHRGHRDRHGEAMKSLGTGLAAFLDDLDRHHLGDRVVVATVSEFGRRVEEREGGLDHGTASTMLVCGAVTPGTYGDHPSLAELDDDGNLVPTTTFDRYYASLAQWLGANPAALLASNSAPIPGLLA